ncbi:MAG: hypothetical protein IT318_02270 [Anaerolineales bacterium]|nr:hypothetical protein [Anaerolineales bacterium]
MPRSKRFGQLPPRYRFALNLHADYRASRCPRCNRLTYPRKFALLIHVDPDELRVLGKTCKFCSHCQLIIAHQDELEAELAGHFQQARPGVIGNAYLVLGTVEKAAWRKGLKQGQTLDELRAHTADIKEYLTIEYEPVGWFPADEAKAPAQPGPARPAGRRAAAPKPPRPAANYTELVHQVVREAAEPLSFAEIFERVEALAPITTKNPKATLRNAVSQSRLIRPTGDGRYGWLPRLITGAVLRVPFEAGSAGARAIRFPYEVRDALWPAFFEVQKRGDRSPAPVQLPDGRWTEWPLDHLGQSNWGTRAAPEFWAWLRGLGPRRGDSLIVTALDGAARRFAVAFERRQARDEAAVAARTAEIKLAAAEFIRKRQHVSTLPWEIAPHLLATGCYRRPVPPEPLETFVADLLKASGGWSPAPGRGGQAGPPEAGPGEDLAELLFGPGTAVYDVGAPPDLPAEYRPGPARGPRLARSTAERPLAAYTLRVTHRAYPDVWRDLQLAAEQTL